MGGRYCTIQNSAAKLLASAALLFASSAPAQSATDTQIVYFEPLSFGHTATTTAASKPTLSLSSMHFEAFGRTFKLDLQNNPRFAAITQKLQADPTRQVLQGQLQGDAGSWARLTRVHSRWHGMIFTGGELYVVEPADEVHTFAAPGLHTPKQGAVIFRLSDTYSALGQSFCGSDIDEETKAPTELDAYTKLIADLKTMQMASEASGATKRLEVSALGDASFLQRFSSMAEAEDAVLARLNNVDGIFSAQLGISIQVPSVNVYSHDPATLSSSTSPTTLLDSLGRLRASNADLQARGVTHLFTGRDLDGTTVGIAYTKSLCNSRYSASLTESRGRGTWTESLIAAHEIGHNFGAVHDGTGVCSSTPQTFLMAPSVNGSSTFSQCSLSSMQELAQTATCLAAIPQPDISLATDLGSLQGYANADVAWTLTVTNVGDAASDKVHVDVALPSAVQLVSASVSGGTCALTNGSLGCDVATVAAKSSKAIAIAFKSSATGAWPVSASVHATSDDDMTNNTGAGTIAIDPSVDLAAGLTLASTVAIQGTVIADFTITNGSDEDSPNTVADVDVPSGMTVGAITLEGGTCSVQNGSVHCTRDVLARHATASGTIQLTGSVVGASSVQLHVSGADHDPDTSNNTIARSITIQAVASAAKQESATDSSGGGGGGGSVDLFLLTCAGLLGILRSRRA